MLSKRFIGSCFRSIHRITAGKQHPRKTLSTLSSSIRGCTNDDSCRSINSSQLLPVTSLVQRSKFMSTAPEDSDRSGHIYHPEKGKLIYVGTVSSMVKAIKIFSLSTSALGLAMQPFILANADKLPGVLRVVLVGTVGFFVVLTPLLLHWITGRYVTQMHYDALTATYTANTYSFFVTTKEHKFTLMDVEHLDLPGILTTIKVNKKPLFFDPELFIDKKACIKLLGYDKPINWSYPSDDNGKKKS